MTAEHYFSENPSSEFKTSTVKETLRDKEYTFTSASGIFSATKVDFGTKLLVDNMVIGDNDRVLDLGCGIGIVGRVAADLTKNEVVMTDINGRACDLAKQNTQGLKNTKVLQGDSYEPVKDEKFDAILLNPPQTAGKQLCFDMIEDSKKYLNPDGTLQIVARHNKGGETLSEKMKKVFGNMRTVEKKGGYRVYLSRKNAA